MLGLAPDAGLQHARLSRGKVRAFEGYRVAAELQALPDICPRSNLGEASPDTSKVDAMKLFHNATLKIITNVFRSSKLLLEGPRMRRPKRRRTLSRRVGARACVCVCVCVCLYVCLFFVCLFVCLFYEKPQGGKSQKRTSSKTGLFAQRLTPAGVQ